MTIPNLTIRGVQRQKETLLILALLGLAVGVYLGNQNLESQGSAISFGGIEWNTDYDLALEISEEGDKPILIYFWRRGCPFCARMESEVFPRTEVSRVITTHFVPVALDIHRRGNWEIVDKYGAYATPTFVIIDGGKKEIRVGYMDEGEFLGFLNPSIKTTEAQSRDT